ncbi:chemotaxis protein CheB [Dactylosporangium sp. NPDC051541]|uniref:chemotaxis protein CheB n=1 Tax=Dactylosporangium sp. NPDC051541 TaxID=3363977 RepID=UPI0037B8CDAA
MDGRERIEVVALVASAGGINALSTVLRALPDDLPAAVIVQQHLGAQGSALVSVLQRQAGRKVVWAGDGARITAGVAIVCPPRSRIECFPDGTCAVLPTPGGAREFPHDALLKSLAESFGGRALAAVLTGMGRDGAAGAAELKAVGGVVIAQSEDTAEQPSMPRAAAEAGADLVLPLHEIGGVIADVVSGGALPRPRAEVDAVREIFGGPSAVAGIARDVDWAHTPLGPVAGWSAALRTVVRLVMGSPVPMLVLWGEQRIMLYNDSGAEPGGVRHPEDFARPGPHLWPPTRPMTEPLHQRAARRLLDRQGRARYAWFDITYSPLWDEHGAVAGVLQSAHERTAEVLAARRLRIVNQLAAAPPSRDRREALAGALAILGRAEDLLFAAAYRFDASGTLADLAGAAGVEAGSVLAPHQLRLTAGAEWPLHQAAEARRPLLFDDLAARFRGHTVGPEQLTPECAILHPLPDHGRDDVAGVLVLALHPRLALDDGYREFLAVVGETVTAKVAESHARQQERRRAEGLAELDRAKTEFFANVSHEFRTPLTLMLAPLEELLQQAGDPIPARRGDVELVQRSARRLLRLVDTLLELAPAEPGRQGPQYAATDLAALTADTALTFRNAAEAAGLKLVVDAAPLPAPVSVDPQMWEKIVANLVANALKFTWDGKIEVVLRTLPKHTELVVRDSGVGIPAEHLPYVFKRFHRVPETHGRSNEGAGIGLALVEELVRRHHGRARVTSEEGRGSTFTVWLPLIRRADRPGPPARAGGLAAAMAEEAAQWDHVREEHDAALGLDGPVDLPAAGKPAGAPVLVVDANADMRDYLVRLLGGAWPVLEARTADEALETAARARPGLILADVMMPRMDGFALLRTVRADPALARTPVVLVTARAGEHTAIEGMLAGADDYIVKPFSSRELLARVGAQLELSRVRRTADEAMRASEERLRRVLETERVGVLFFDQSGTLVDANDVFLRMVGYTRAEVDQRLLRWQDLTPPEWMPTSEEQMAVLEATGRIGPYQKEYFCKDGSRRWMLFAGRDLGDGNISEFCIDITDLKKAEAQNV